MTLTQDIERAVSVYKDAAVENIEEVQKVEQYFSKALEMTAEFAVAQLPDIDVATLMVASIVAVGKFYGMRLATGDNSTGQRNRMAAVFTGALASIFVEAAHHYFDVALGKLPAEVEEFLKEMEDLGIDVRVVNLD